MTITLCIETSGPHCSLALAVDEQIFVQQQMLHRSHNERLLPLLDELFTNAGITPRDVELIGFGCGPGSFTGVRIAAAACQAVALAANAMVVPISSAWVLAATAATQTDSADVLVSCVSSRGQAYYLAAFKSGSNAEMLVTPLVDDELCEQIPDWLLELDQRHTVKLVGQLPIWLAEHKLAQSLIAVEPSAQQMVARARAQHANGDSLRAELALPRYISGDSPWRKQNER